MFKPLKFRPTYVQLRCIGYSRLDAAIRAARMIYRDHRGNW